MQCIDGKTLDGWRISSTKDGYWAFIEDEKLYIFEWTKYHVEGTNNDLREVLINGKPAKRLKNGLFVVSFGNFVGLSELVLIFENGRTITMPVEVLSSKLLKINPEFFSNLKSQYEWIERLSNVQNAFVDALIGDILQYSQAIPFYLESPTAFSVTESDEPINELFAYHFLRSNKTRIIEAFEVIMHRMKRELRVEEEWLRPDEVDEVTPETLISIAGYPEYLAPAGDGVLVAKYLNGYVPTKVLGSRKYESFDTPENRFAKHFLNLLIEWGERVLEAFGNVPNADLKSVKEFLGGLEFIRSDSIWGDVGEMTVFPYTSQTLLKGDGYRDLLELYREFTAYVPFFEELQRAIDNRDIAKLYEYWAFFRLVEELSGVLGKKSIRIVVTPAGELSESGDVYAQFDNGWRLYYNKRLTPRKWSYSVTLRPDFSLFRNGKLIGVFDAKFKLDVVDEPKEIEGFDKEDEEAERSRNYTTWAKLEDIYKMHTYRDALGCNFAVVLYPGRRSVFFDIDKGRLSGSFDFSSLLSRDLKGVGYIRVAPEVKL
ncbi:hypothetical protein X802_06085 [Thermococcus guaymasensis DSM 11113]|uniref:DUF2357 domain-containing protein n=1 Tax=Thermococcus guaymasensis DSM 11113 TaxID=1432656 RepID=A0A0X1KKG7_9EURY|nr:DUF2357 domain-containing protein [Thermococcus guaymasensis]AJC71774.1 hypothetical protein X802_06085 [Thermococcus guaymasensis DSM 11113]